MAFELYLAPEQKNGGRVNGYDLERHLYETGLIDHCLSLEDEAVKGWIANPSTYPKRFRRKTLLLWKSRMLSRSGSGKVIAIACLYWDDDNEDQDDRVVENWESLEALWSARSPVLLRRHRQS
ncbi:MAG: hypothetical protein AAB338_01755 [Patescibacteria group bacterium]